jgi:hypothetical protein
MFAIGTATDTCSPDLKWLLCRGREPPEQTPFAASLERQWLLGRKAHGGIDGNSVARGPGPSRDADGRQLSGLSDDLTGSVPRMKRVQLHFRDPTTDEALRDAVRARRVAAACDALSVVHREDLIIWHLIVRMRGAPPREALAAYRDTARASTIAALRDRVMRFRRQKARKEPDRAPPWQTQEIVHETEPDMGAFLDR